jgi:hypothetical protein
MLVAAYKVYSEDYSTASVHITVHKALGEVASDTMLVLVLRLKEAASAFMCVLTTKLTESLLQLQCSCFLQTLMLMLMLLSTKLNERLLVIP